MGILPFTFTFVSLVEMGIPVYDCKMIRNISFSPRPYSGQYWRRLAIFTGITLLIAALFLLVYVINLQVKRLYYSKADPNQGFARRRGAGLSGCHLDHRRWPKVSRLVYPRATAKRCCFGPRIDANRVGVLPQAVILAGAGYPLLLFDLRGNGRVRERK